MAAKDSKTTAHMAVAIWVMIGAVMGVLGRGERVWGSSLAPCQCAARSHMSSSSTRISRNMIDLALIQLFLGQPPNAFRAWLPDRSHHRVCHWFMGSLFVGWSVFFIFVLWRFR
jgi:hypothetical protein